MTKKNLFALMLALVMLITAAPLPAFAEGNETESSAADTKWEISKSKTAEATETEDIYDIVLSLPSAQETLSSDVVFVLDKSSCSEQTAAMAEGLLQALIDAKEESGASIKVAVVSFRSAAANPFELTELDDSNKDAVLTAIKARPSGHGTNIEAGLTLASDILENDTAVEDHRKYIILVSDGLTRTFLVDGENSTIFCETSKGRYEGSVSGWSIARNNKDGNYSIPGDDWDAYWENVKAWVEADGDTFVTKGVSTVDNTDIHDQPIGDHPYVAKADCGSHALCIDRSFYNAWKLYTKLENRGYHCYTQHVGNYAVGIAFLNMLGGGIDFTSIKNDILYLLDKGSTVEDYMGYDESQPYDFDFVDEAGALSLKVGGNVYEALKLEAAEGAESVYGFKPDAQGEYSFKLFYFPGNKKEEEHFTWAINEAVSNFAPVSLTYQVKLAEKSETPGEYEADTNLSAWLTPVDSSGNQGEREDFEKPSVTYSVPEPETSPQETTAEETTAEETTAEETTAEETTAEETAAEETTVPETESLTTPKTGDDSHLFVWVCVCLTIVAGMTAVVIVSKKRSIQE